MSAQQRIVLLGSGPNSGQGDNLYTAFDKINNNFNDIYTGGVTFQTSGLLSEFETIVAAYTGTIQSNVLSSVISTINSLAATTVTSNLVITGATNSTSTNSGALIVRGGVGIGSDVNVAGAVTAKIFSATNGVFLANDTNLSFGATSVPTPNTYDTRIQGSTANGYIQLVTNVNGYISAYVGANGPTITITSSTSISASTTTGALVVNGGLGVGGTVNATSINAANITLNGISLSTSTIFNGGTITNPLYVNSAIGSITTSTGALQVTGGVGIGRNITIGYDNNYVSAYFGDPYNAGTNNVIQTKLYNANSGTNAGVSHVITSNVSTLTVHAFSSNYSKFGLAGKTGLYSSSPNGMVIWESVGNNIQFNVQSTVTSVSITSSTNAISTNTATLIVTGGVGISGGLYVGATITATNLVVTNVLTATGGVNTGIVTATTANITGNETVGGTLSVVYQSNTTTSQGSLNVGNYNNPYTGQIATFAGSDTTFSNIVLINNNSSSTSYASYIVANNSYTNYMEMGVNSTNYNSTASGYPNNSFSLPGATFLESVGSDLVIGTWNNNNIHVVVNGSGGNNDILFISTGTSSVVLTATGSVSIGANVNIGGAVAVGTQTVLTNAGVSVGPISYFTGTGTIGSYTISNSCQYFLINSTFTSMTLYMPASPISGQVVEISTRFTLTGLTHVASPGQFLSGGLSSSPSSGTGGKWVYFTNASTSTWFRLDKAV